MKFFFFTQNVDKWSFDVFALNEASGDHALKFIFYELLTRYDLISRFKVKPQGYNIPLVTAMPFLSLKQARTEKKSIQIILTFTIPLHHA